jgi:hypothetical protein
MTSFSEMVGKDLANNIPSDLGICRDIVINGSPFSDQLVGVRRCLWYFSIKIEKLQILKYI